jgi:DNA-binding GntR family transcriptional regulator
MIEGKGYDEKICVEITAETGIPAIATTAVMVGELPLTPDAATYTVPRTRYNQIAGAPWARGQTRGRVRLLTAIKPVDRPVALGDQVYLSLRELLRDGKIRPGEPLQEAAVAAQLQVSRTPVREALARLASEGLVAPDGRGFVVPLLGEADIEDIYEVRGLLEPAALRDVAARKPSPRLLAPLKAALEASVAADRADDARGFMDANTRFRAAWIGLVPNPRLVRAIELHTNHVRYLRVVTLGDAKVRAIVLRGLRRIAAALAAGNVEAVAKAMLEHLGEAKRSLRRAVGLNGQ